MTHLTEEQLILHYYGEEGAPPDAASHLRDCEACRAAYGALVRVLNMVDAAPVPEPAADYAAQVWQGLRIGKTRRRFTPAWFTPRRWAVAAAMAVLLVAAFLAGRYAPRAPKVAHNPPATVRDRILLVAVGDYLERSRMVLVELANTEPGARGGLDISAEQQRAEDLISETRLYRQTAGRVGEVGVAGVLDELERVLLEIAHGPSRVRPEQLDEIRRRIEAQGILFKLRVLETNMRSKEETAVGKTAL